ncbi:hypothetical protein Mtc_2136 [Methanocella conradii HZ254]|uniref:Lipoprotein n=1 Tax=Methanocella conradii (strain DSM 24694 / JCM 17849 / CGMCC 1.5162 / HZ254) TaxID=1041930 RepID=H8I856_METCZ|nr:hypothetical protein [Methanocella conradii]AFD00874.1 hypothetical protein Mtc_2136 [Methanocella conradii HZ254]
MKPNAALMVLALIVTMSIALGCTSTGGSGPGATAPGGQAHQSTVTPQPVVAQSLTDAQKDQAISIAKGDSRVKDVLDKQGYKVTGVVAGGKEYWTEEMGNNAVIGIVTIQGGETERSDGSLWTPDMYNVIVDVNGGKVINIIHIEPKPLPTPKP